MKENDNKKVIHINHSSAAVDAIYFPQVEVVGDIANSIWQIKERVNKSRNWNFTRMYEAKDALIKHSSRITQDDRFPIFPPFLVEKVREAMPSDGIITMIQLLGLLCYVIVVRKPITVAWRSGGDAVGQGFHCTSR